MPELHRHQLEELRPAVESLPPEAIHPGPYGLIFHNLWRRVPLFAEEIERGRLAALAMELLEAPSLRLFQDLLISKPPGTSEILKWHQDFSYWPLDAPRGITLWIALDDADLRGIKLLDVEALLEVASLHRASFDLRIKNSLWLRRRRK